MQNSFKNINEIVDNLLVICDENCHLPKIEKDILLDKIRQLYLKAQAIEEVETELEKPENYDIHPGIEEDVDLFFDTDHESYGAPEVAAEPQPEPEPVPAPKPESEPVVEKPAPEPVLELKVEEEPVSEPVQAPAPESQEPKMQPSQAAPKPEKVIEPEPLNNEEEDDLLQFIPQKSAPKAESVQKAEPVSKPEPKPAQPTAPRSLNDLFNKQQEDRSLGSQFQHAKVGDLTKAISINDKFIFIKELFNNKGEEFSAAIQQLNQCPNMDAAFDCLEGLKKQYYWDSTSTAYLSLCDLLRRKFQ